MPAPLGDPRSRAHAAPRPRRRRLAAACCALAVVLGLGAAGATGIAQALSANDAATVTAEVSSTRAAIGETVDLTVTGADLGDLYAFSLEMQYDPTHLRLIEDSGITDLDGSGSYQAADGTLTVTMTRLGTSDGVAGALGLFGAEFAAIGAGTSSVTVSRVEYVDSTLASRVDETPVRSATITTEAPPAPSAPPPSADPAPGDDGATGGSLSGTRTPAIAAGDRSTRVETLPAPVRDPRTAELSVRTTARGASSSIALAGFEPGRVVRAVLTSDGSELGTATIAADGRATLRITVPVTAELGDDQVQVLDGDDIAAVLPLEVVERDGDDAEPVDGAAPQADEPSTTDAEAGSPAAASTATWIAVPLIALAVIGAIIAVIAVLRRRASA